MRGILLALAAASFAFAACGKTEDAKPVTVGIICPDTATDGGWNQQGADAAKAAAMLTNQTANLVESVSTNAAESTLRDMAKRGTLVAICHGAEYLEPAEKVAAGEDKMKIIVTGANPEKTYPHIYSLDLDISGPCYQLGVLAGKLTQSGKIGFIAGGDNSAVALGFKAFEAGAKSVRPDVVVSKAFTDWGEPLKSKTQAEAFIQQGTDVIFQDLDKASKGVFEAIAENNSKPKTAPHITAWVIGCNSDQNANGVCGDYTIGSCVIRLDAAFAAAVKAASDGTFKPGVHTLNIVNGETRRVLNPKLTVDGGPLTKEMQKLVEDAGKKYAAGEIKP